jgi:hypothetical protein
MPKSRNDSLQETRRISRKMRIEVNEVRLVLSVC